MSTFLAVLPAYGEEPRAAGKPATSSTAKSVTVFPIILTSNPPGVALPADVSKNMAELVGLMLERGGMTDVEIADKQFTPPQKADLPKVAEAFGQYVQTQKLSNEYALYGQFIGTPGKGVDEILLAAVDRNGKVLLSERMDRGLLVQLSGEKLDPMLASYRLVCRLRGLWGLADPQRKDAPEGKMARLWAEKSGGPPKSEREAMQPRLAALKKSIKTSTIAVFPARVSAKSDTQVARQLAKMLTAEGLGRAEIATADPNLTIQPSTNQVRIIWDTGRAFRDFLRKSPPMADYGLFVAYGIGRTPEGKPVVGGVNIVLCNRQGEWVLLAGRNSHQPDFQQSNPQSADDCNRLVVEMLKSELQ
jgi:hypothetical protein